MRDDSTTTAGAIWWDSLDSVERAAVLLVADAILCRRATSYEAYLIYADLSLQEQAFDSER